MTTNKHKYEQIIKDKNDIIADLELDLETQIEKLDKLVDQVKLTKAVITDLVDIYHEDNNAILNISNFLAEQNHTKEASLLSKCKLGNIILKKKIRRYTGTIDCVPIKIVLYCPGDAYNDMEDIKYTDWDNTYHNAFKAYFTKSYVMKLYNKTFNMNVHNLGVQIEYELNVKRITPKESDVELFFEKIDRLKKMLKSK